jgi:hypothetical protein
MIERKKKDEEKDEPRFPAMDDGKFKPMTEAELDGPCPHHHSSVFQTERQHQAHIFAWGE